MNRLQRFSYLLVPVLAASMCTNVQAGWGHGRARWGGGCGGGCADAPCASGGCAQAPCQPAYQTVEKTIMVPEMVSENRTIDVVECQAEQQQYTYSTCRPVTEKHNVEYTYTVASYETKTREVNYTVCKPVMTTQQQTYTVMVPHTEVQKGTRPVCKMVEVTKTRTVCEDHGSWKQVPQTYTYCCCGCVQTCTRMCNVWEPKIESREVQYTVCEPTVEQVPYEYNVTVCKPETHSRDVQICNYVQEPQTRTEQYQVCVPKQMTGTREVATCRLVTEQHTGTRTIQVPHTVQKQITVQVCKMVPKKITCQVPVNNCNNGCATGCGGCQ